MKTEIIALGKAVKKEWFDWFFNPEDGLWQYVKRFAKANSWLGEGMVVMPFLTVY
jgi:hypothetical protein